MSGTYRQLTCTHGYEERPEVVRVPTSCHCGGDEALVIRVYGTDEMVGCSCHHDAVVYRDTYWHVAVFDLVPDGGSVAGP